jgi:putative transposase
MKRYTPKQIVEKLRQVDVELGKGKSIKEACRILEISEWTYYRWRQKYGGMSPQLIKELKDLQKENQRLRKIITDHGVAWTTMAVESLYFAGLFGLRLVVLYGLFVRMEKR